MPVKLKKMNYFWFMKIMSGKMNGKHTNKISKNMHAISIKNANRRVLPCQRTKNQKQKITRRHHSTLLVSHSQHVLKTICMIIRRRRRRKTNENNNCCVSFETWSRSEMESVFTKQTHMKTMCISHCRSYWCELLAAVIKWNKIK